MAGKKEKEEKQEETFPPFETKKKEVKKKSGTVILVDGKTIWVDMGGHNVRIRNYPKSVKVGDVVSI